MNTFTKLWYLEDFILFNSLGKMMMVRMAKVLDMFNINKGEIILLEQKEKKHIFFLKNGAIKIIDADTEKVKYIVNKGSIFGEIALLDVNSQNKEIAIALEDCTLCSMEADKMLDVMRKYPFLKNNIIKAYASRIKKLEQQLDNIVSKDNVTRIKDFVMEYTLEFGEQKGTTISARNLLSHKDISHLTNTSRQTVSTILNNLRKEGVINYDHKTISIPKNLIQNINLRQKKST